MTVFEPTALQLRLAVGIRIADSTDIPKLEWYGQYKHFRTLLRRAYREQLQGRRVLLVADFNDFPIGQLFIQLQSNNPRIADGKKRAYLYSFRVMDMFRGQGIGTLLIKTAENMILEKGFKLMTIAVAKENHGALRLYERLNYRKFAEDSGRWTYTDHLGVIQQMNEPCWILEKNLILR